MKKTLLSSMLMVAFFANAQNRAAIKNTCPESVSSFKKVSVASFKKTNQMASNKRTASTGSAWFNKIDFNEYVNPGLQTFSVMHVFPDSAITLGYTSTGTAVEPFIHKAANYMDPSFMAQQNIITNKFATYTLDSISIGYLYERNTGASNTTADSLIVQVIAENHALDYSLTDFPYQDIEFNFATQNLKSTMTVLKRLSIPLTFADTCSGGVYKQILAATPGIAAQTNSKKIGVVVSFKPGYTYTPSDILISDATHTANKNIFYILSSEENGDGSGAGTDPTILGVPGDYTSNMNMSYVLNTSVRYNINANGWNGYFLPTYAFTTAFSFEDHDIGYKLSVSNVGVNELESNGFALNQNQPNPFSKESVVNYSLSKDVNSAVFSITDVTGRIISSEKVNTTQGNHSIKLGSFAAGLYYYSLNIDGKSITKKMIVE